MKKEKKVSILAMPFYFIGGLFKSMYDELTAAQEYMEQEQEAARKKAEQETKENEKFYHDLEKTSIYLDDIEDAYHHDIDKVLELPDFKHYQSMYEKKLDNFIARNKEKLDGDELRIYLLLCRNSQITVKWAAEYLHCDSKHAYYILESLCERLYITKCKRDGKNVYRLLELKWYREY